MIRLLLLLTLSSDLFPTEVNAQSKSNSFEVLLPDTSKTHTSNWFYNDVNSFSDELSIPRLDKGFDSICIRIWKTGVAAPFDVISISSVNSKWIATRTFFWPQESTETKNLMHPDSTKPRTINLKLDFPPSLLLTSLEQLEFLTLPSQREIPAFKHIRHFDGFDYLIEFSTRHYYKIVQYHCPAAYASRDNSNLKVLTFLDFISKMLTPLHVCGK